MAIWHGDVVEILIETNMHSYYQIAVNPAGVVTDLDRGADRSSALSWNSKAEVATHIADDHWTIEIRIPVTTDESDPLSLVIGRKPSTGLPWLVNVCRQRVHANGSEFSALSPTGSTGFHHRMSFAHLHAGLSHTFDADPTVKTFIAEFRAATALPKEKALPALVALAEGSQGKLTEVQVSAILKQAAILARSFKELKQASELTARIPIEAERKNAEMLNLLAERKAQDVISRFGDEDLGKWPFWAAGEGFFSRGRAFASVGNKARAEADFKAARLLISEARTRTDIDEAIRKLAGLK